MDLIAILSEYGISPEPPKCLGHGGKEYSLDASELRILFSYHRRMTSRLSRAVQDARFQRLPPERRKAFLLARYELAARDAKRRILPSLLKRHG